MSGHSGGRTEKDRAVGDKNREMTGGCECRAVRYRLKGPAIRTVHRHYSMCRKSHGALFASHSQFAKDRFTLDAGADSLGAYESSPGIRRSFCSACGSQLFFERIARPDIISITTGTLDAGFVPGHPPESERHIFVASKAPWEEIADDLPRDDEHPPEPPA